MTQAEMKLEKKYAELFPFLDEKQRRLLAAGDAQAMGRGGISVVARASGLSRPTIHKGIGELQTGEEPDGRARAPGGGRKSAVRKSPAILKKLESLVDPSAKGDPMSPLLWTCKSTRQLADELSREGMRVSHPVVADMLRQLGYSLQANVKTLEEGVHEDRDEQFQYISGLARKFLAKNLPVISVDTKKKELVGPYKNGGREWLPKGGATEVKVHDFPEKGLGKAIPYGVYDVGQDLAWVSVGCDHDTAAFAVESIRRWWRRMGRRLYPRAEKLLVNADSGGSNGYRVRLWKVELQSLANELGMDITVCHFPPGTSKWNKIEHRLFSHISMNWRGRPLVSHEVIVNLISATTTRSGLRVSAGLDENSYPDRMKVSVKELAGVNMEPHEFHGEWNYTIRRARKKAGRRFCIV